MWHTIKMSRVEINIFAKPNAKKSQLLGVKNDRLHVLIHAKPEDGKANAELIHFLSELLKLPKKEIILQRGETSKYKVISVPLTSTVQTFLNNN